jgi:hypothetical protein
MKASRAIFLLGGFSSGLAAALLVLVAVLGWETFSLRDRLAEAQQRHQTAAAELARLQAQQDQTESRLTEHRAQLETLRAELEARRDAQTTNAPAPPATRVRVFANGRYLGTGWMQSGEARTPEAAVYLEGPVAAAAGESAPRATAAVTAFSVAQHYPGWPWLWTVGWLVGEATNNMPAPRSNPAAGNAPANPPANPDPPPGNVFVARTARTAGTLAWPGGVWRTVPRGGQPRIELPQPPPVPPEWAPGPGRTTPSAGSAQTAPLPGRPAAPRVDRPIVRR